ncbi:unnamed protein product [Moneuplotes crassus]|uniref:Protein kinase domain-containing protein n=1 Tax=Euplotes crassus TaxID=5936 RepID=A0AAD1UPI6_EUPCR|nr:unnamed protein product [Moneuplotes crassus]
MDNIPDYLVLRLNGTSFLDRREEILSIEYNSIFTFAEFKMEACRTLRVKYDPKCRLFDKEGIETFEDDLNMLKSHDVLYLASRGEDFDYSSVLNDYDRKDVLGEGGFGKVYHAVNRETGEDVAIKFMDISHYLTHADQIEEIYREADALQKLNHSHIISLHKAFVQRKEVILIMEYAGGGELKDRVEEMKDMDEIYARFIFQQICSAMSYCHNRGLIHRDLKLENVLFKEKGGMIIKIVDFGIAGVCKPQEKEKTDSGTLSYMPPEVLSGEKLEAGPGIDIWALGVMLYTMIYGKLPFYGDTEDEIINCIIKKKPSFKDKKTISKELKDLLIKVLNKDSDKRLSMFDLQNHKWMEMQDEEILKSIEESKLEQEQEEEKK